MNACGDGTLVPFADSIWTATTPIRFVGTWFPHVMSVVRLGNGELLLHSPCYPKPELIEAIARLGSVAHVIAPNWFHDLYLAQYRRLYPAAAFWAPAFLQWQRKSLIDHTLDATSRPPWFDEMPHVTLAGLLTFNESIFFHKKSRTLIVADVLMNASPDQETPWLTRLGYRFFGLDGRLRVFPVLEWFGVMERASLRNAAQQIIAWNPDRLIVGHGKPIEADVPEQLHQAFHFTVPADGLSSVCD